MLPVAGARVDAKAAPADVVAVKVVAVPADVVAVKVVAARVAVVVVVADPAIPGALADTLRGGCPCARARWTPSGTAQGRPAAIS